MFKKLEWVAEGTRQQVSIKGERNPLVSLDDFKMENCQ